MDAQAEGGDLGGRRPLVLSVYVRKGDDDLERIVSVEALNIRDQQALLDLGMVFDGNVAVKRIGGESRHKMFEELHKFEVLLAQVLSAQDLAPSFK